MLFFQSILQVALLAQVALGATCAKPAASCKAITSNKAASSSCSQFFQTNNIKLSTCTQTVTKPVTTTTNYVKKGKSTVTKVKTSTSTKTVRTSCATATIGTTKIQDFYKTAWAISTKVITVKSPSTSWCTKTQTVTKTATMFGESPAPVGYYRFIKRVAAPASCACFSTKTSTSTKVPARVTKTVGVPSGFATKWSTKKEVVTRTYATAQVTKWSTHTSKRTKTLYSTSTRAVTSTSTYGVVTSTTTKTATRWITQYSPQRTTTITRVGNASSTSTIRPPQATGVVTVIIYRPQATTRITRTGTKVFTTTLFPTNGNGQTVTDLTGTKTVIVFVPQRTTTITRVATGPNASNSKTTLFPTNGNGQTITDGSGTVTVIDFVTEKRTTITRVISTGPAFTSTLFPTNGNGNTITDGSGTLTVVVGVTLPATTITRVATGSQTYLTTLWPTGNNGQPLSNGQGTKTVINFITQPRATVVQVGTSAFTTTVFPNPTDPAGTISVINFVTQPVTTITSMDTTAHATTIFPAPTNVSGTITVIQWITQPVTTITRPATGENNSKTTLFPTNSAGSTITDGSGTITVIDYVTRPVVTITRPATGSGPSATTIYPPSTDPAGTVSVITYAVRPTTTVTRPATGSGPSKTTIFPASTDPVGTVSVIDYVTPGTTATVSRPATGNGPSATTIYPPSTDPAGTVSVITYVVVPTTTLTRAATGIEPFVTTIFPASTNPFGTVTVIKYVTAGATTTVTRPATGTGPSKTTVFPDDPTGTVTVIDYVPGQRLVTVTRTASQTGLTTVYTTDSAGEIITDGPEPITVITYVKPEATITRTKFNSQTGLTTVFPTNSAGSTVTDGSQPVTVITYVTERATTTKTMPNSETGLTTLYPTDGSGSTIIDGPEPVTVVTYVKYGATITRTQVNSQTGLTTVYPTNSVGSTITDGSEPVRVITYVKEVISTVTRVNSVTGLTTVFPIDSSGQTITDGSIPRTVITYITQATITVTKFDTTTGLTTQFPTDSVGSTITDGSVPVTVITYVKQLVTTVTSLRSETGLTTLFPTNSAGSTITDGSVPITVVTYIKQLVTTVTSVRSQTGLTTLFPTNLAGSTITDGSIPITVVTYIKQPVTTVTSIRSITGLTTLYPTNSVGSTITDDSGTLTVVTFVTQPKTTITRVAETTGLTTILPTGATGVETIITFITQPVVTLTSTGSSAFTTTYWPTNSAGSTVTDGTDTITIVEYVTNSRPRTTVTLVTNTAYTTTVTPTDPTAAVTVIKYITQPITTISRVGTSAFTSTNFPINSIGSTITDGSGTITVIDVQVPPFTTVTTIATDGVTGRTTIFPASTDVTGIGSVIVTVTQARTTVTRPITSGTVTTPFTTTISPNPTDPAGTISVIVNEPARSTPDATCDNSGWEVGLYDYPYKDTATADTAGWVFEQIGTSNPYNITQTSLVGFHWITGGTNTAAIYPYGLTPRQGSTSTGTVYVLNMRGYFYAPKTQSYIFTIYNMDDIAAVWVGDKAFSKWCSSNADLVGKYDSATGQSETKLKQFTFTAGTYTPIRILFANGGTTAKFDFDIIGSDGVYYVKSTQVSSYMVTKTCDDTVEPYPEFGYEFPTPDRSCLNSGLEVAVFDNPFTDVPGTTPFINIGGWTPEYFNTALPKAINDTSIIGLNDADRTRPHGFYRPTGVYALMYRGYFWAPFDQEYTFTVSNMDDIVQVWLGDKAVDGWSSSNIDVQGKYCTTCGTPSPTNSFSVEMTAGQYIAVRVLYGNGGSSAKFNFDVTDEDGFFYVKNGLGSQYTLTHDCDDSLPTFNSLLPDASCDNVGLEVGIFVNPFINNSTVVLPNYNPEYFGTQLPYNTAMTNKPGVVAPGTAPQGFTPKTQYQYTLTYRGYFFAPRTSVYTFNVSRINDIVYLWTGDKAYTEWTADNADGVDMYSRVTLAANYTVSFNLTGGTYLPIRLQYADGGNGGEWAINIKDEYGVPYVSDYTASPYLVSRACQAEKGPSFPDWGAETLVPDSCDNDGLEVAIYGDPFADTTTNYATFRPHYFKTITPYGIKRTQSIGIHWDGTGTNTEALNPHGFVPQINLNYTLNYRGYFFAPKSGNYSFRIYDGDNWSGFWLGQNAYSSWNRANTDGTSIWNPTAATSTSFVKTIQLEAGSYTPLRIMLASWAAGVKYTFEVYDDAGVYYVKYGSPSPYLVSVGCDVQDTPMYPPYGSEDSLQPTVTINQLAPTSAYSAYASTVFPTESDGTPATTGTVTVYKYNTQAYTTVTVGGTMTTQYLTTAYPTNSVGATITDGSATATVIQYNPPAIATSVSGPVFNCSKYGYIINNYSFNRIDVATSQLTQIKAQISGTNYANAIGYNVLDNYIYGIQTADGQIIRIAQNGQITNVAKFASLKGSFIGDITGTGQYFVAHGGTAANTLDWYQIDLKPGSATYGKIVASGTTSNASMGFADWAYIPAAGNYLWSLATNSAGKAILTRFDMATKKLATVTTFSSLSTSAWGAMFASNNGDIYAKQNASGKIWKVNVFTKGIPVIVTNGQTVSNTDGARCVYYDIYNP